MSANRKLSGFHGWISPVKSARLETKSWMLARLSIPMNQMKINNFDECMTWAPVEVRFVLASIDSVLHGAWRRDHEIQADEKMGELTTFSGYQ
jgi:hypothetical protein